MKNTMPADPDPDFTRHLKFEPLSKSNWNKFVALFGERGACGNCWCQTWRFPKKEFEAGKKNEINKNRMKELVWKDRPTGILAFYKNQAIAWCALAPREDFIKLERSRVHKRIDDQPVWSITCFFISKAFRMKGVSVLLLRAVIDHAAQKGIPVIEAYPLKPTAGKLPDAFAWIGLYRSFEKAGFTIVNRTSKSSPTVRYYLEKNKYD